VDSDDEMKDDEELGNTYERPHVGPSSGTLNIAYLFTSKNQLAVYGAPRHLISNEEGQYVTKSCPRIMMK